MEVPFFSFEQTNSQIREALLEAFAKFLDQKEYIMGPELSSFEQAYAAFSKTRYAVGVANGMEALHICLKALNIGPGDEVIVPAHTFVATLMAVTSVGASPVLVEPNMSTYNIDVDRIESVITSRTKAIIPVHLYGRPCDMEVIMAHAQKHALFVVEDNAQAHGAMSMGKPTGSLGQLNASSFYPVKNLGALGDGGIITTDDPMLYERCMMLRNYGSKVKYYFEEQGLNSRLDEVQAAFLKVKLPYIQQWNEERRRIANYYQEHLKYIPDLILPIDDAVSVFHLFIVRTTHRDTLRDYLRSQGIATGIHYPVPPHLQKAYSYLGYQKGQFPITEQISETILSLPLFIGIKEEQLAWVCQCIHKFYEKSLQ
ncbi:MAG TPA: DegT/DnrJ/EryC1/StrS family aminotransferase [Cytophagales bacterium]|nr:DegT/DnrJ/EryC1/StrS family aminotransferase [Cytophagales bacterium]